jgi:hypothetical protein
MKKIMRTNSFLVYVCGGFVLAAVCTARADATLWYNGDLPSSGGGTVNEQSSSFGVAFVYDNFTVTDPAGWIVDRLWSNDAMQITGISQASWNIRSGMSVGNGGTVVSSGIGFATQTLTGRVNPVVDFAEYTIQISGLNIYLPPGTYWLSVAPLVGSDSGGVRKSYISRTSGANAVLLPETMRIVCFIIHRSVTITRLHSRWITQWELAVVLFQSLLVRYSWLAVCWFW